MLEPSLVRTSTVFVIFSPQAVPHVKHVPNAGHISHRSSNEVSFSVPGGLPGNVGSSSGGSLGGTGGLLLDGADNKVGKFKESETMAGYPGACFRTSAIGVWANAAVAVSSSSSNPRCFGPCGMYANAWPCPSGRVYFVANIALPSRAPVLQCWHFQMGGKVTDRTSRFNSQRSSDQVKETRKQTNISVTRSRQTTRKPSSIISSVYLERFETCATFCFDAIRSCFPDAVSF